MHARRRAARQLGVIGDELREARLAAGVRQAEVGRRAQLSQSRISRIERGLVRDVGLVEVGVIAAAVGLELGVRLYPAGSPLRDKAHIDLISRLRAHVSPKFRWQVEVPLPIADDRRGIDVLLRVNGATIGVEVEVRLRDLQAVLRRVELKQRDGRLDRMVLLLAASKSNRLAVRGSQRLLREALPIGPREVLRALEDGRLPEANGYALV